MPLTSRKVCSQPTKNFSHIATYGDASQRQRSGGQYLYATLLLNNGVDVLGASQRLGHAHPSITLDVYGHLMPSMQNKAAEVIDELLSG
jgi:integrase